MIVYALKCGDGHHFEAWFRDGAAFDAQAAAKEVVCPVCGDNDVSKAPMAPRIGRSEVVAEETRRRFQAEVKRKLGELRTAVEKSCDYVGDRFAEEARRIHYGETDPRGIYGETSDAEASALAEEGVAYHRIPWLPRTDS
jgi:hypothetical protein